MPDGHMVPPVTRRDASQKELRAQAAELKALRADRPIGEWADALQTPYRSYRRYEDGERAASGPLMVLARQLGKKKRRG